MRRFLHIPVIAFAIILVGCAGPNYVTYSTGIESVERPTDAEERYGEYTVTEQDTTEGTKYIYQDDLVRAGWVYSSGSMLLTLENKSEHSIQIRLEQGAFVMPGGDSERIILGDMSYADRNQEVRPITVPSGASTSSVLIPEGSVDFNEYGATVNNMFEPERLTPSGSGSPEDVESNVGRTFSVLLPIDIQGTVNEYTFTFEVTGAKIGEGMATKPQVFGDYPSE